MSFITANNKSEQKFRALFESSRDAILLTTFEGVFIDANPAAVTMFGGRDARDLISLSPIDLSPEFQPDGRRSEERVRELITRIQAEGSFFFEWKHRRLDGAEFIVEISAACVEIGGQRLFQAVIRDVSERKQAEEKLRESEFRFRQIANSLPQLVWTCQPDGVCDFLSQKWLAYTGIPETRQLGYGWMELLHPDDCVSTLTAWQAAVASDTEFHVEFRIRRFDGEYRWFDTRAVRLDDSNGPKEKWFGTNTDITERKQSEIALRDKERMLSESQRIAHIGSWALELETGYISWSDEMYRIYGVTKEEFGHTPEAFIDLIHPEDADDMEMWINDCVNGKKMQELDFRIIWPDGTIRFIRGSGGLEFDETKRPLCATGSAQDITERKYREQGEKNHLDELAHVTRLGLMGEMASGIAHELKQPLTAISTYAQTCLNYLNAEKPDQPQLITILSKMQEQASRAGILISRMREFVKSDAKRRSTADINALIINCVDLCNAEVKQSSIALTVELQENLPSIHVDQIQIEQVLINLIRNSIDALNSVVSETRQRQLAIHSRLLPNHHIEVRVKDNGPGLDEEQKNKILMPFYTTKSEGMGMGLSISRSLIEAHDGTLHFNSQPAKGTSFYFTLPIRFKSDKS